jgi:large subunit ribosomal protein L35
MPKQKTHKGLKKRFKVTASGKIKHRKAGTSHLLSHKSSKRKRQLRGGGLVTPVEARRLRRAISGS